MAHFKMFTVGEGVDAGTALHLAQHFYPNESIDVVNVGSDKINPFEGVRPHNLSKLVFLGHADTETFGELKAAAFVKKLADNLSEEQKAHVQDLYLVGCEMGLIEGNGVSLAQDICNQLAKKGFTNVRVHSVAKPEDIVGDVMRVSVTTATGLSSHAGNQIGYISAYTMTKAQSDTYEAESKKRHVRGNAKRMAELEKQFITFAEFQHPQHFLDEAINVFIPGETSKARYTRIHEDSATQQKTRVISLLTQRMEYKQAKKSSTPLQKDVDAAEAEFLRGLIEELNHTPAQQWKMPLSNVVSDKDEKKWFKGIIDKRNRTTQLLKALVVGDFDAADDLIKKQKSKGQPAPAPEPSYGTFVRSKAAAADQNTQPTTHEEGVSARGRHAQKPQTGFFQSEVRTDAPTKSPIISDLITAKQAIRKMVALLTDEIDRLSPRAGGLHFFNRYEMTTKTVKKVALERLLNENSIDSLQATAVELMRDARIMRSAKTSRTKDLLTNIRDSHFDAFREAPQHVGYAPVN